MRIRVWSPVQVVPDVTGTEQHTGQMFVVDACSKNRICMATKRNIKHEGASKWPIYVQITVSLRLRSAFRKVNALHWVLEDGSPNYNPSNSHAKHLQCDFNKRNHTARLYKNTQTEYTTKVYLGRRPRELLPSKYKIYLVQEYRQKDEKCRCQSRGNKSGPKD